MTDYETKEKARVVYHYLVNKSKEGAITAVSLQCVLLKKKIVVPRPWRSFLPGIGSVRSASMNNNDDIPTTDTSEIKQLINHIKQGELDH